MGLFNRNADAETNEDTGFVTIDPDLGKKPVLPAGEYQGVLDKCDVRPSKWNEGRAAHFEIVVRHDAFGIVRLFADKDLVQGTPAIRWYRQLGVTPEEMKSGINFAKLSGLPVQVTVGTTEYEPKDPELDENNQPIKVQKNVIKNVVKL